MVNCMRLKKKSFDPEEQLKPIPVTSPIDNPILFYIRCLFDLQLKTITDFLRPKLGNICNSVLDIGAGNSPWKSFLGKNVNYIGLDTHAAKDFNIKKNDEIIYYSGGIFPFSENRFNHALCIEVLEHIFDTETFLSEIFRCLAPNGKLILTVPWSARRHHLPYDYFRFTPEALEQLFFDKGFTDIKIETRGNDFAVIFNKILCVVQSMLLPKKKKLMLLSFPIGLILLPNLLLFFILAHLTIKLKIKSHFDPLGFSVTATKPINTTTFKP